MGQGVGEEVRYRDRVHEDRVKEERRGDCRKSNDRGMEGAVTRSVSYVQACTVGCYPNRH